ncbi:MAG: hypothetical protein ACI9CD_000474 [Candidatus Deianiraeaceae bacterium]|jgi:hypothetical protein
MPHTVVVNLDSISIETHGLISSISLCGVEVDSIVNQDAIRIGISKLIIKHESLIGDEIDDVYLVCNIFSLAFVRASKIKQFTPEDGCILTNTFVMKACKVYETYGEESLRIFIDCLVNIGINVVKVCSSVGLMLMNSKEEFLLTKSALMFIGRKDVFMFYSDGAGSVMSIKHVARGLVDIRVYIQSIAVAKFPHITQRAVSLILQKFIYFSELEMIEKIHNTHYDKNIMSFINYNVVRFISSALQKYLMHLLVDFQIHYEYKKLFLYTQDHYTDSVQKSLQMILSQEVIPATQKLMQEPYSLSTKKSLYDKIFGVFRFYNQSN